MAFVGLVISTVCVEVAARRWDTALAVNTAYLGAFGAIWVAKYVILDKVLFATDV